MKEKKCPICGYHSKIKLNNKIVNILIDEMTPKGKYYLIGDNEVLKKYLDRKIEIEQLEDQIKFLDKLNKKQEEI